MFLNLLFWNKFRFCKSCKVVQFPLMLTSYYTIVKIHWLWIHSNIMIFQDWNNHFCGWSVLALIALTPADGDVTTVNGVAMDILVWGFCTVPRCFPLDKSAGIIQSSAKHLSLWLHIVKFISRLRLLILTLTNNAQEIGISMTICQNKKFSTMWKYLFFASILFLWLFWSWNLLEYIIPSLFYHFFSNLCYSLIFS